VASVVVAGEGREGYRARVGRRYVAAYPERADELRPDRFGAVDIERDGGAGAAHVAEPLEEPVVGVGGVLKFQRGAFYLSKPASAKTRAISLASVDSNAGTSADTADLRIVTNALSRLERTYVDATYASVYISSPNVLHSAPEIRCGLRLFDKMEVHVNLGNERDSIDGFAVQLEPRMPEADILEIGATRGVLIEIIEILLYLSPLIMN